MGRIDSGKYTGKNIGEKIRGRINVGKLETENKNKNEFPDGIQTPIHLFARA
ncbi:MULTISPECIES: hypothetical protein [unclassified Methanosarcina]|uniref:hypothetical protein n=1 Tax=unclassified Methanosarcina TaxID=2644672 RepID=UPI0012E0008B|nr:MULTISPECIES: hypothetical protein [unclassified Methanosarcina]